MISIGLNGTKGVSESKNDSFWESSGSPMLSLECKP